MANPFKTEIKNKIPASQQNVDFKLLLSLIEKRNIRDKATLDIYLRKRELVLKDWIRENDESTSNTNRRRKTRELELIKNCKKFLKLL